MRSLPVVPFTLFVTLISACTSNDTKRTSYTMPASSQSMELPYTMPPGPYVTPAAPDPAPAEPVPPARTDQETTLADVIFRQVTETCIRRFECQDGFPPPPTVGYVEQCAREETKTVCAHLDCSARISIDFEAEAWQACLRSMRSAPCTQVKPTPDRCDAPKKKNKRKKESHTYPGDDFWEVW